MAKDPAVLWYWNDWHGGTCTLSRFLKGCYMDLLHAQFNSGNLSIEEIKTVLGSDFGSAWPALQKKFKQDDKGLFFNERLVSESIKRKSYSKSRRENLKGRPHMEDEDEIKDEDNHKKPEIIFPWNTDSFLTIWKSWKEYRKSLDRFQYKDGTSEQAALVKLSKLSNGIESMAIEIIKESMSNGWKGFFLTKNNNSITGGKFQE